MIHTAHARFLEAAPDAIVVADGTGTIVIVNAQTEKLFGYRREDILGKPLETLVPGRFRGRHMGHRTHYFSEPQVRSMGSGLELYGLHSDGTEFPVEISLSPIDTENHQAGQRADRASVRLSARRTDRAAGRVDDSRTLPGQASGPSWRLLLVADDPTDGCRSEPVRTAQGWQRVPVRNPALAAWDW